uniref:NADPH:adrenodoxin oxidoreductase, mitochondrial n=1 Tax=Glossina brevipalpis TaxID=37001 RepID=A0A1A9X3I9_9MUSC
MLQQIFKNFIRLPEKFLYRTTFTKKRYLSTTKICIVGAGPSGFYAAQYLLKHLQNCQVDVVEKLPTPFGLVRFGVAPDHPEVKNVINTFSKTAASPRFQFYGNVCLGKDVTLQQLRDCYHVVLLTYGADRDRQLDIPNENEINVLSAREFVAWYNGLPGAEDLQPNLSGDNVTIIGQGNVAIDVARMLLSPLDELKKTDITSYALDVLTSSKVQNVYLVGRRGPLQVAFTIKELREMLKLPQVSTIWKYEDFDGIKEIVDKLPRPRKRLVELMLKSLNEQQQLNVEDGKNFIPIFLRSPQALSKREVTFTINKLEQDRAIPTNTFEVLQTDLVLRSIGYTSSCVDTGIHFNMKTGCVSNENGRVVSCTPERIVEKGLYVAGWLATGPTGVILTTMNNSFMVAKLICDDIAAGRLHLEEAKSGIGESLKTKAVVTWEGWSKIDAEEVKRGRLVGKPREKIVKIQELLKVAGV